MLYYAQLDYTKMYDIRIWECTDFAQHWHSQTEIYICLQGQMRICIEGIVYCLNQDDVVFVSANEAHEIFCKMPKTLVVLISFGYELLGSNYNNIQNVSVDTPFFNLKDEDVSLQILQPLMQIRDVLCQSATDMVIADWNFCSSLYAIAVYIVQHQQNKPVSAERLVRAKHLEKMNGTLRYICEHFREPITVEQAARAAGYDKSYFCKQFRKTVGMTFHRYLNYYRISEACGLLSDSELTMSAVAERAGFASQKNLSRLFRDVLGMTPTQYRKLPQKAKNSLKTLKNILY